MTVNATDQSLAKGLQRTAQQVTDAGLPIKVAVIGNKTDLGAVPQLWAQAADLRDVPRRRAALRLQGHAARRDAAGLRHQRPVLAGPGARGPAGHRSAQGRHAGRASPPRPTRRCSRSPAADGHKVGSSGGGGGGGLPWPFIAAGVMVVAGVGGGALILRGDKKTRARLRALRQARSAGVSASPGRRQIAAVDQHRGLAEDARALLALARQLRPERARDRDRMAVADRRSVRRRGPRRPRPRPPRGGSPRPRAPGRRRARRPRPCRRDRAPRARHAATRPCRAPSGRCGRAARRAGRSPRARSSAWAPSTITRSPSGAAASAASAHSTSGRPSTGASTLTPPPAAAEARSRAPAASSTPPIIRARGRRRRGRRGARSARRRRPTSRSCARRRRRPARPCRGRSTARA